MNKRHYLYSLPIILLLIVAVAGWFATDYLGNKVRQEIIGESHASVLTLSIYVSSTLTNFEGAVKSLAGSPWIAPALMSKTDQDIENANSAIDRYNSALNASVTYLMAADGMTLASSNRIDPDSFVGKSYRFRPYFQEAARGQPGRYFALGITSGKRGFYASYPVQNHLGEVMGVVTMKKDIDEIETFFSKYPFCFLISPDGIIFLSGTPAMVTKSLWPIDKAVRETLIASRQFGNNLSEPVIKKEIADGTEVALEGKDYFVSRNVIDSDGWSIVLLTPIDRIMFDRLIGILATIFVGFLIMVFSGIIYDADRSKEAIRQSEESKRLLLLAVGEGIFGVDARGQVTFINPAALRMLGFAEDEMLGQSVHDRIHHSHEDGSKYPVEDCPIYDSYTHAANSHVMDGVFWRKDGSSFPVEYSSMPITQDGKVMGSVVNFTDITERRQTEEALRESEARFKALHNASFGGIGIHDKGIILDCNQGLSEMTGYPVAELIGMNGLLLISEKSRNAVMNNILSGYEKPYEAIGLRKNGKEFPIRIEARNVPYKGKTVRTVEFRDITEQKQAEKALRESEEKLLRSKKMESLGLLAGGVAHDLNNVLSGIVSYPELILMDLPEDSVLRKPIETMKDSGDRAVAIVQDLLTVARGVATIKAPTNLNDLIHDYLKSPEFKTLSNFHPGASVRTSLEMDLLNVNGSQVHIRKVLMNLVSNAVEAVPDKGTVTLTTMNRYVERPIKGYEDVAIGEYAVLSVSDDGPGISEYNIDRIFEPFYSKKVMGRSGTGLGLAVVWNVVQDHKGYIDVTTGLNGTTFELYFPITRNELVKENLPILLEELKGNGETILVVDDVANQRTISCAILNKLGYRTTAVSSGEEAVEFLRENPVDLLLLDMIMDPGINGRETYARVLVMYPDQKAIIVSGFAETEEVTEALRLGAVQFLRKPVSFEKIGLAVKKALGD